MDQLEEKTVGKVKQARRSSTRQKDGNPAKSNGQSSDMETDRRENGSSVNGEAVDASDTEGEGVGKLPPAKKRKTTKSDGDKPSTVWCHHERRAYDPYVRVMIECQTIPQEGSFKRCVQSFCRKCLEKFYGEDVDAMFANGEDSTWRCPVCRDVCECSACRKKKGLELLGRRRSTTPAVAPVVAPKLKGMTISKVALRPLISGEKGPSPSTSNLLKPSYVPHNFTVPILASPSPSTATTDTPPSPPKKQRPLSRAPPPPKRPVPPAPFTLPLSSAHYPHPDLPCTNSILSRLNLREFFLRFNRIMPALDLSYFNPSSSTSDPDAASDSSSPKSAKRRSSRGTPIVEEEDPSIKVRAQLNAKTLASLSNDILGIKWDAKDDESSDGEVQLVILEALVDLLRSEKKSSGVFKEEQYEAFAEIDASIAEVLGKLGLKKVTGHEEKLLEPWVLTKKLIGEKSEWLKLAKEWSGKPGETITEKGQAMETEGTDVEGKSEVKENGDSKENGITSQVTGDERLAISCALIDMAYDTEVIRQEVVRASDDARADLVELNKEKFALRNELARQQKELSQEKHYKPDGTGVRAKAKIDQWKAETKKIDKKLETLEIENNQQATRVQHDIYVKTSSGRLRFEAAGTDSLSNEYFLLSPAPSALLDSNTDDASTSAFPINEDYKDPTVDYPITYSILVHGTNPSKAKEKSTKSRRGESTKTDESPQFLQDQGDDWFVVRDPEEIENLAEWVECMTKQVEYEARYLAYTFDNPTSTASRFAKGGQPSKEVVERAKERMDTLETKDLVEKIRQFKDFVSFEREKSQDA